MKQKFVLSGQGKQKKQKKKKQNHKKKTKHNTNKTNNQDVVPFRGNRPKKSGFKRRVKRPMVSKRKKQTP